MPSKGIDVYSYISVPGYQVEFTVPGSRVIHTSADNFTAKHLEVDSSNVPGRFHYIGRFKWRILFKGEVVDSAYNDINSLTGKVVAGNMTSTVEFLPIVTEDAIVTYGFYVAGHGKFGLTKRHQCYVTICSKDNAQWMGAVAPPGSSAALNPFSSFVLAAPHDNGMNGMTTCEAILATADEDTLAKLRKCLPPLRFFDHIPNHLLLCKLPHIVYGLAMTQKKEIPMMLELGARYFEFRPAKLLPILRKISQLPDTYYFHHSCVPGLAFDLFLEQVVTFLDTHLTEFVVVHVRWDGVIKGCERPSMEQIHQMFSQACSRFSKHGVLHWGGQECFTEPIDSLRRRSCRLICIIEAEKYDSWTAEAYATLTGGPILERFESMTTEGQLSSDLTILQCQATSQSIKEVLVYSVMSAHAATSCLTSTKAFLDTQTLPWIRAHALGRLQAPRTIVVMNDFIDGATTDTAIELSRQRLAFLLSNARKKNKQGVF
ncbi:hypothetical protein BGZ94_009241 [Podila epigama]|nr:hypothetical protein BGZ94_009241 [Podila epigama]